MLLSVNKLDVDINIRPFGCPSSIITIKHSFAIASSHCTCPVNPASSPASAIDSGQPFLSANAQHDRKGQGPPFISSGQLQRPTSLSYPVLRVSAGATPWAQPPV
ncbi:hypothetical protein NCS52_00300800 [Fusarium sp. LHS14.1]|nr:hypothetical protein NCS52_00300800 [Fusarium sp. LHS14.1]